MDTKKFLLGTIAGGISYFMIGWLVYGIALESTMATYSNAACMRPMEEMVMWSMILGNLGYGALLTFVFLKSGNVNSFGSGAQMGALIAFLLGFSVDMMMYATSTLMTSTTGIAIDVITSTVIGGVVGGIIGVVLGMGSKPSAA